MMQEFINTLIPESHALNMMLTKFLLYLNPDAYGDCNQVCGFVNTLHSFIETVSVLGPLA